jgi:hypothetical protein
MINIVLDQSLFGIGLQHPFRMDVFDKLFAIIYVKSKTQRFIKKDGFDGKCFVSWVGFKSLRGMFYH